MRALGIGRWIIGALVVPLAVLANGEAALAAHGSVGPTMKLGGSAPAPSGYVAFCRREPLACAAPEAQTPPTSEAPAQITPISMTPELKALIHRTNERINRAIAARSDLAVYGQSEVWTMPLEEGIRFGDCEDYVLEKRRALMAAGVPEDVLSIAVVQTDKGELHVVLLVDTTAGELVLDNLTPWVLSWSDAPYRWVKRQAPGSTQWASIEPAK